MEEMADGFNQEEGDSENRIHIMNDEGQIVSKRMVANQFTIPEPDSEDGRIGINKQPEEWLPITQSRKGNSWTATFHLLCSGIGTQTLSLPLAFVYLGW